jgi:hypothetical protein
VDRHTKSTVNGRKTLLVVYQTTKLKLKLAAKNISRRAIGLFKKKSKQTQKYTPDSRTQNKTHRLKHPRVVANHAGAPHPGQKRASGDF